MRTQQFPFHYAFYLNGAYLSLAPTTATADTDAFKRCERRIRIGFHACGHVALCGSAVAPRSPSLLAGVYFQHTWPFFFAI